MRTGKILWGLLAVLALGALGWAWRAPAKANLSPATEAETAAPAAPNAARAPVLVELFTSEGCSSCPPADEVLQDLERAQPVNGAEVIALSLHVDYWNYIGWADPFSSAAFSQRQNDYSVAFGRDQVYTPQMVVDGRSEFVGSGASRARESIAAAAKLPKAVVAVQPQEAKNDGLALSVKVTNLPAVSDGDKAEVFLAVTESNLRSNVSRGENSGRRLTHTAVVRQLNPLGPINGAEFQANPTIALNKSWQRANLHAVVFVQERRSRHILGAASAPLN